MASDLKPVYLITGTDEQKIGAARSRLRERAEREGGEGALQVIAARGAGAPDPDELIAAIPALSLVATRRYLLVDGVQRWSAAQAGTVAEALGALPEDVTVVLICSGKLPRALGGAVKKAGGETLKFEAPKRADLASSLVADASDRGFELETAAARSLVVRMGERTVRLAQELDRLALWAGPGGTVTAGDLESMVADTSEAASWTLSDAIMERRADTALITAERLSGDGESVTGLVYALAKRLRDAEHASAQLEQGMSPKEVANGLQMHPYAAKQLVQRARSASRDELRDAVAAIADLEFWTRGGSDYPPEVALSLSVRRAAGAAAGGG
ncbi:MAG: DNA polymerase III subunit delta [Solirubrobacterales bacterium]